MKHRNKIRLIEFFVVGVLCGVIEDLIAITFATEGHFEWRYLGVAAIVAFPFAIISELIVDHPDFWKTIIPKWFIKEAAEIKETFTSNNKE
jgi:hypothetical protein